MEQQKPFFSVIIPTYNHPGQLAWCLQCITDFEYPHDRFEVIVVDDGSDLSPDILPFKQKFDVTLIAQPNAGPAAARNAGAAQAKGEYLAFTDDDCCPAKNWLSALASSFLEAPDCAIGGRTINGLPQNLFSAASQTLIDFVYSHYNQDSKQARFFASNNLAVPAKRFHAIGGFDPALRTSEDRDFCDRWLQQGYRMISAPDAIVYHSHELTVRKFWRQHFEYGRGAFLFRQKMANRMKKSISLEPKNFYFDMLRYPFSQNGLLKGVLLSVLLLISQTASAAGFAAQRHRSTT